jgi:hypothetical protein
MGPGFASRPGTTLAFVARYFFPTTSASTIVTPCPSGCIDARGIQAASKLSNPREIGLLLAREKANAVSINHPGSYVIGADQTLALGGRLRTLAPIAVRSHRNARTSSDSGFAAAQR